MDNQYNKAREEFSFVHGRASILKEIEDINLINELIGYKKKADTDLRKEIVIAGKKLVDANMAAAEVYMKKVECVNKEN